MWQSKHQEACLRYELEVYKYIDIALALIHLSSFGCEGKKLLLFFKIFNVSMALIKINGTLSSPRTKIY